jgi:hypothetical protein
MVDDLAARRARRAAPPAPMIADCDGKDCGARGVFDNTGQMGGWFIDCRDRKATLVLCPRCNDRRRAPSSRPGGTRR